MDVLFITQTSNKTDPCFFSLFWQLIPKGYIDMEEEQMTVPLENESEENSIDNTLCVICKNNKFIEGYSTKLCDTCRQDCINYPIPKWIWLFAAGILLIMIFGMIRMPKYISAAYHLSRAEKAIEKKEFVTAQKELLLVTDILPDHVEANGNLLIAAAHNHNFILAAFSFQKISGKEIKDNDLYINIEKSMKIVESNYPSDTTLYGKIAIAKDSVQNLKQLYAMEVYQNSEDQYIAGVIIASNLYDKKLYADADTILLDVLKHNPDYYPGLILLASVKRKLEKFDYAIAYCDQILVLNNQDVSAYAQKVRIELMRKDDSKADEYAKIAMEIDSLDISAMEAKAMVCFYSGKKEESFKLLAGIQKQESGGDSTITIRLTSILNNKTKFR